MATIVRAQVAHTPRNPFLDDPAVEPFADGAVAFSGGRIRGVGAFSELRRDHPGADVLEARDALLLPGFVDCQVHFPQIRVIGAMDLELMDWLRLCSLPEEARLADPDYAEAVAEEFIRGLAANGTTTASVFASHFPGAQEALFATAARSGLRIASGLVVSDHGLLPELQLAPEAASRCTRELIGRWRGRRLLRYAVTPRFSVSCSEEMLALGTDVGAGTGLGMLNEGLMVYHTQRLMSGGVRLGPADLLERADSVEQALGPAFTLAREESIAEVRVAGEVVRPGEAG